MLLFAVHAVFFGIFAALTGGQRLQIRPDQRSHTKAIGNAMLLTCEAKNASDDDVDLKWIGNNDLEITDKNGRLYIEDDSKLIKKLYITSIRTEDAGKYSCQAKIGDVDLREDVTLEIFHEIAFKDFPQRQHPKIHTDALISCLVTGQPVPVVSWRNKGTRLKDGARYSVTSDGLIIRNITESDNGDYTCRGEVESDGRYSERTISVAVHIPPTITKAPGDVEAELGAIVSLACEADGLPKPEYKFYKDDGDAPLKNSENIEISETDGSLRFMSLTKVDEGSYTCNATNSVGFNTGVGKVKVLVKPTISQFADVVGVQDKEAIITCVSEGDPQPMMSIRKESATEVYTSEDVRVAVSSSEVGQQQVTIRNLTIDDGGRYICIASNKVGSINKTAAVTVHFMPRFTEERHEIYNWAGNVRNLTCEPLGEPAPSVEWFHAGAVLKDNSNFHIYKSERSSTLQVTVREVDQRWIYGDYLCEATNDYGNATSVIDMKRATAPDMPRNVSVVERTPTAVVLEVHPSEDDGGVAINGYSIEYSEKIQDPIPLVDEGSAEANETEVQVTTDIMTHTVTVESTDSRIRIENLKASTTYTFKARAKNEVGLGNPYEFSAITDAFKKPQPIVINSYNVGKDPSQYTVTWEAPETGGKPIQRYMFSVKKMLFNKDTQKVEEDSDSSWSNQTVEDNSNILSHTLKDLSPSTHYKLKICAANEIGWSESTNEFSFSTSEELKDMEASSHQAQAGTGLVVGIVLAVFIVFLIIVDVSCYFLNSCGLTMFLCGKCCKKESLYAKEKAMEEGEREHLNKPTAPEEKDEELKEPLKDEIPLEHPKAIENEEADVMKKPEVTANV